MAGWVCILSAFYRFQMLYIPFQRLAERMGRHGYETPCVPLQDETIKMARWIVPKVCRHTPWESKCLVQALTAKRILNRNGLPGTIYMGVRRDESGKMQAHAWLRCGTVYVTGGDVASEYIVTGMWGDAPSRNAK